MAFNIPGTDIVFGKSKILDNTLEFGGEVANFFNPFKILGNIFNSIFHSGGSRWDRDSADTRNLLDKTRKLTRELDQFTNAAQSTSLGGTYLNLVNKDLNEYHTTSGHVFTLRQIFDGTAAGMINDIPGVGNSEARAWWNAQLPGAVNVAVGLTDKLDSFTYDVSKFEFGIRYPDVTLPFEKVGNILESGINSDNGQVLLDGGFTGNQIADINKGTINIGGTDYLTTEDQAAADAAKKAADDAAARKAAEDAARKAAEDAAAKKAAEDAARKAAEDAARKAADDAAVLKKKQEQEQFIKDNHLSSDFFDLTPEQQQQDLFIAQSQQFLDVEAAKADLLTQKQLFDSINADANSTQEQKDNQTAALNTSLAGLIQAGILIGAPIGQILTSEDVTSAVKGQTEDVGVNFRNQTPDLKISPTLAPSFSNTAGLLGGGGGFTTKPSTISGFSPAPIADLGKTTFNQFEDTFKPTIASQGFPKPRSILQRSS